MLRPQQPAPIYAQTVIYPEVEETLLEERVRLQQREQFKARRLFQRRWHRCHLCSPCENDQSVKVQGYYWENHLLNHRILRAIGGEKEWIESLQAKARAFEEKRDRNLKRAIRRSLLNRAEKRLRSESARVVQMWLKRKFPYDRGAFKRKVEWVSLQRFGAFVVVDCRLPFNHDRHWDGLPEWPAKMVRKYAARLIGKSNANLTVLFECFLGSDEKQVLRSLFANHEVVMKHVIAGPREPFQFILYTTRNQRQMRSMASAVRCMSRGEVR